MRLRDLSLWDFGTDSEDVPALRACLVPLVFAYASYRVLRVPSPALGC